MLREEKSAWDRGFVATLRGRDDGPAKGEVWTIDEQNDLVHVASGCAASFPIDDAIFGSLLTIDEERALADLVTRHALTGTEARPGGLALHKVLDAYRTVGRGTNDGHLDDRTLDEVASVLRRAVRVHHPSMRETDAEERIGGFLPLALDGKARRAGALRPLTEVEERDLVELSVREAVNEETLRLRHLALVGLISGDGLSRFSEASRSWLAGRVRARRPDQADAFERRARRQVCAQNAFEERMFLEEMAARQREHFERHGAFTDSIDELSVDGRLPTRLVFDFSQSTKERVVVEARYPEDSLLVGHHVRFEEGKRLQVLRDACAGLRSSMTDEE